LIDFGLSEIETDIDARPVKIPDNDLVKKITEL